MTVEDTIGPNISRPDDVSIECGDDVPIEENDAEAEDTCNDVIRFSYERTDGVPNYCSGMVIKREWTATDTCENESTAIQTITITDTTPPEFSTVPNAKNFKACDPDFAIESSLSTQGKKMRCDSR